MGERDRRRTKRREPDYILVGVVGALLVLGLLMVYSTTFDIGYRLNGDPFYFLKRQTLWAVLGVGVAAGLASVDYHWLRRLAVPILVVTVVLLILVLVIGESRLGARRSLLGGSVQPGELAKLTAIIYIAVWASSKGEQIRDMAYGLIPFTVLIGFIAGLVMRQPDQSSAAVIALVSLGAFFMAGADLLQLILGGTVGAVVFLAVAMTQEYARERLVGYVIALFNPEYTHPHVQQALIALGSGRLWGVGLGMGHQKFGYLPFPHTDSVFAVLGEEMGLLGCLLVLFLFALLAWRGFRIALEATDEFGAVLAFGLTLLPVSQALFNVGVVTGILPPTGIAFPFLSVGGSSLLVSLAAVGILLSVSRGGSAGWRHRAVLDSRRWNGRARLSRPGRSARA